MSDNDDSRLSRRERQIMDIVYELGQASAAEVRERLPDPPGYSAVRALLAKLEAKRRLRHVQDGPRYVFLPTVARREARESAIDRLLRTFFDGSPAEAVSALLGRSRDMSDQELDALREAIDTARRRGRDHD